MKLDRELCFTWSMTIIAIAAVVHGFVGCQRGCEAYLIRSDADNRAAHKAWQQLHPETQLSYEDWDRLRQRYLLPGQTQPVAP